MAYGRIRFREGVARQDKGVELAVSEIINIVPHNKPEWFPVIKMGVNVKLIFLYISIIGEGAVSIFK
jgi:hypothetical protein